jgi:hypothetical protein
MTKTHDRDHFFKYVTARAALKILETRKALWSSPLLFNDPFDTQFDLNFGFALSDLHDRFLSEFEQLVYGEEEPKCDKSHPLCVTIRMLRAARTSLSKEDLLRESREALVEGTRHVRRLLDAEHIRWRAFLEHMRVFCVAERHDNLLMWAHYTDRHRGAVLKFKCLPEFDTALCVARAMTYRPDIPSLATLDDWIRHSTGQARLDFSNLFHDLAFSKSDHWSYELEWRCWTLRPSLDGQLYEFCDVLPQEVHSIYLGCKIDDDDRKSLAKLLNGDLAHVEVYQASPSRSRFELVFERVA